VCDLCSSWARLQVIAVGTTTDTPTPDTLAALAITDGRQPLAFDLGVRVAAADSPVVPLTADRLGRLTLGPIPTEPLPSPAPSNLATLNCCSHASHAGGARGPSRTASNPACTASGACAAASVGEPHHGCCSPAISAFAHANPFLLLAETGKFRRAIRAGGSVAWICMCRQLLVSLRSSERGGRRG
jgi:hypothetical protein